MSLRWSPLLYIFLEVSSLPRQREFLEHVLGLRVIENQFHPPHEHHGLVKYDAGGIILSLNLWAQSKFQNDSSDGLVTAFSLDREHDILERLREHGYSLPQQPGSAFTDVDGHHYILRRASPTASLKSHAPSIAIQELHLMVSDLPLSLSFYGNILGLKLLNQTQNTARFATGTVDLVLQRSLASADGRRIRYNSYLPVFYTRNIHEMREVLVRRGLSFKTHVGFSDIGGTTRFADPSGHTFCLYEPSLESLTWGSGPKVKQLTANDATAYSSIQ